ncbi:toxin-antitoxin system YwqK family antitoxin [Burkholderia gladioli]|uniref:toxin-antitoxin system YwqK family antitoxin n=1 Tax=Burkholderia gladioli TaxID=28095 RepID=UPI0034DB27A0
MWLFPPTEVFPVGFFIAQRFPLPEALICLYIMNFTFLRANTVLLAIAVTSNLAGCKGEVLDYRNAQMVNGKVYASGANEPFSGKLTNAPSAVILGAQQGFRTAIRTMERTLPALTLDYISAAGIDYFPTDVRISPAAYCDAQVSNGYLDGKAICKAANSDHTLITMSFTSGQLDGELDSYAPDDSSHLFAKVAFRNGNADGRMEVYSPTTHRLVHTLTWANGVLNGDEEGFDENTGNRVLQASLVDGKYEGKMTGYATDRNMVIYSASYANGLKQGVEDAFDPQTGKPTGHAEYVDGKLDGTVKRWNADGKLIYERDYRNGLEIQDSEAVTACLDQKYEASAKSNSDEENVDAALHNEWEATCKEEQHSTNSTVVPSAASASTPSRDADTCVSNWTAAYRRENGADAMVTADQLGEWKLWCKAGKQPS